MKSAERGALIGYVPTKAPHRLRRYLQRCEMAKRDPRMVSLGYGKFARADRIYALVPLDPKDRGEGRRTYVHVDDMA